VKLLVEPMELEDIPEVLEVDRESYTLPWPASAYRREVLHNRNARYLVLREISEDDRADTGGAEVDQRPRLPLPFFRWPHRTAEDKPPRPGHIVGYAGMWIMMDEAHITTIALRAKRRGQGLGELLLASLMEMAFDVRAQRVTLEVRVSNEAAQRLYRKYGFRVEGTRARYYSDNNEDAYIMTTENIQESAYRSTLDHLVDALRSRLLNGRETEVSAPAFPDSVRTNIARAREAD
jgi:[ribosomal protein S18]-alanine N-acetyltransferase